MEIDDIPAQTGGDPVKVGDKAPGDVPAGGVWDDFFRGPGVDMPDRDQPAHQDREAF